MKHLWTPEAQQLVDSSRHADDAPWACPAGSGPDALAAATAFELRHRLPVYHLQRVDHLSAAHGVEARVPFCRDTVRAMAAWLPAAAKVSSSGDVKVVLAAAARRHAWAPEAVLGRPKQPFTFRLSEHLLDHGGQALAWSREILTDPSARRGWFDTSYVEKTLAAFEERRTEDVAHAVWALLICELWMRDVINDPGGLR